MSATLLEPFRPLVRRVPGPVLTALFGLCLTAAAWGNVASRMAHERQEEVLQVNQENDGLARAFEEHARRVLKTADNALLYLKKEYERYGRVTESMLDFVESAKKDPILNQIALADAEGNLLVSAVPLARPVNIAHREAFQAQRRDPALGLDIAKPIVNQTAGKWSVFLSRRLNAPDGSFRGIVSVGLDPLYFSSYFATPELGSDRAVLLVGRDGVVRARRFQRDTEIGQDISAGRLFRELRSRASGHHEAVGLVDGLPRFASFRAMPDYPLIVLVSKLRSSAFANLESRRAAHVLSAAVFTFFVWGFCLLLMRAEARTRRQNALLAGELAQRHKAEEERLRLERQLLEAQKLESLGVLAGGIAHDFNNLLMVVLGNTELALASLPPGAPQRASLENVNQAAQRAAELTNQMLAYAGRGRFVVERVQLSRLVGEMGHLLASVISKGAEVRYRLDPALPLVEGDPTQLRQVVMNLITNASDALGERGGVIDVATRVVDVDAAWLAAGSLDRHLAPGRYVAVEVGDSGAGMDPDTRARIFEPFFTTKAAGRGLGLAAVLGIVQAHRGGVRVASEPGRGTTFTVLLPAAPAPGEPAAAAPDTAAEAGTGGAKPLVLVVDDEQSVRTTATLMLEECGYRVATAADGVEGLEVFRARAGEIAVVLLDMTMPRLDGEQTFLEMRGIAPEVPVIISSGYAEQDAVNRFAGEGFAGFLQKPYRLAVLAEKVRAAAARRGSA